MKKEAISYYSIGKERAIAFSKSGKWRDMSDLEIVKLQLYTKELCVPWGQFHESTISVLGRPIMTHEFARAELLQDEFEAIATAPTLREIWAIVS